MFCHLEQNGEDHDRDLSYRHMEQDLAGPRLPARQFSLSLSLSL
jgi:hypothetical protein